MSVRLYTQEEIVNHLENSSLSKYMYSFGKARRFRTIDKRGKSDMLYILPSTKMTRKAGIGYGRKYDFTKDNHRDTEFISLKRSYDPQNCPGYRNIDMNIPGPAKYDILKTTGSESPKYSFRKLCGETFWVNRHMNNPSPAEYGYQPYINEKGRFINSKVCNIKGAAFSRDHSNRWTQYNRKI